MTRHTESQISAPPGRPPIEDLVARYAHLGIRGRDNRKAPTPRPPLTPAQLRELDRLRRQGWTLAALAKHFRRHVSTVARACTVRVDLRRGKQPDERARTRYALENLIGRRLTDPAAPAAMDVERSAVVPEPRTERVA